MFLDPWSNESNFDLFCVQDPRKTLLDDSSTALTAAQQAAEFEATKLAPPAARGTELRCSCHYGVVFCFAQDLRLALHCLSRVLDRTSVGCGANVGTENHQVSTRSVVCYGWVFKCFLFGYFVCNSKIS